MTRRATEDEASRRAKRNYKCGLSLYRQFGPSATKTNFKRTPALPSFTDWNDKESKIASASEKGKKKYQFVCRRLRAQVYVSVSVVRFLLSRLAGIGILQQKSCLNSKSLIWESCGRLPSKLNVEFQRKKDKGNGAARRMTLAASSLAHARQNWPNHQFACTD